MSWSTAFSKWPPFADGRSGPSSQPVWPEYLAIATGMGVYSFAYAGARRFVMLDLPNLGHTPTVLQNTTYVPEFLQRNDTARRIERARRLTRLRRYHNQLLEEAVARLRAELSASEMLLVGTYAYFQTLYNGGGATGPHVDHGYDLVALAETLEHQSRKLTLQQRCFNGSCLGPVDEEEICPFPKRALYWDAVHPTTLTHCWQAWNEGTDKATAG